MKCFTKNQNWTLKQDRNISKQVNEAFTHIWWCIDLSILSSLHLHSSTMQEYHQQHHHRPQQERLLHRHLPRLGRPHLRVPHHLLNRVEEEEVSRVSGWPRHLTNTNEVVHLYPNWHGIRLFSDVALIYLTLLFPVIYLHDIALYTILTSKLPVTRKSCICEVCVSGMDEQYIVLSAKRLLY